MKHTTDNSSKGINKCIHGFKLENVYFRYSLMQIVLKILGYEGYCNTEGSDTATNYYFHTRRPISNLLLCNLCYFLHKRWFSIYYTTHSLCMCDSFCGSCYINLLKPSGFFTYHQV